MDRQYYKSDKIYFITIIILLSIASFNLFYRLGNFPIYSWDEARHGVSAYEMLKNHNFIVNTYRGKADYWNLKPPLSFWAIAAGFQIAGFNAWGFRLFSAIFAILTILMVTVFTYKKHGKIASIVSTLVLLTCTQYITNHSARTGDADSLFVFLFTIAILSLLLLDQNAKWLYVSGLAFALAFLTKSWHSGNIAIIISLYLFITGKYKQLTVKNWILLAMCMLLPIFIWGVFRYQYDGLNFFKGMIMYDLLQRSASSIEGHVGGIFYYVSILSRFFIFWIVILCLLGLLFLYKRNFSLKSSISFLKKDDIVGICLWVLIPFILFTFAKTKIRWYILPIYPPLSIIVGALAGKLLQKGRRVTRTILFTAILSVSIYYEWSIVHYLNHPAPDLKQSLINQVTKKEAIKSDLLYIYHPSRMAKWSQSDVLSAELADDFHIANGSFKEFLKKNNALLMVPKKLYDQQIINANHLEVISSNQWGYIVEKANKISPSYSIHNEKAAE